MSGLSRKKIRVRGKNGKTFQRSVMVKSATAANHYKTAAWTGFARGVSAGVGTYTGMHAGHSLASRVASKQYARDKNSTRYHKTAGAGAQVGLITGTLAGTAAAEMAMRKKSKGYQAFRREVTRNPRGMMGAQMVHQLTNFAGWGAGVAGSAAIHAVYNRRRK